MAVPVGKIGAAGISTAGGYTVGVYASGVFAVSRQEMMRKKTSAINNTRRIEVLYLQWKLIWCIIYP